MADWREPRVPKEVSVRIRGTDHQGNPFVQETYTLNISRRGARLEIGGPVKGPGEIVQLQRGWKKAHYQVVWMGEPGTPRQNQVGLQAMDPNRNIWGEKLPAPVKVETPKPEPPPPPSPQRPKAPTGQRKVPRYRCHGSAQIWLEGNDSPQGATVEEISAGGCFLETTWPLPVGAKVEMLVTIQQTEIRAKGKVNYIDPSMGMGVVYTEVSPGSKQDLSELLARLGAIPTS